MDATAATAIGVALEPADVDGAGTPAEVAATAGEAVDPALTAGAGTEVVAATTAGAAVTFPAPEAIPTVKPAVYAIASLAMNDSIAVGAAETRVRSAAVAEV